MKTTSLALISLLILLLVNCSSSTEPNAILTRLLEAKMAGRDFEKQPSGKDTLKYYGPETAVLVGTHRLVNDHLVITIYTEELEMEHWYDVAIYTPDEANNWKPVFAEELIHGRLDTIIDLDSDQRAEFIVDEYNGNSAGFNSSQALFARLGDENTYSRIDTLSTRYYGGSAYNVRTAKFTYIPQGTSTMIVVHTEQTDIGEEATTKVTTDIYTLYWQPPYVMRQEDDPPPPAGLPQLAEAQSNLEELNNPERKNGLLAIKYSEEGESASAHNNLYFNGSLSDLRFRDYDLTGEGGDQDIRHLEFENNALVRGTKLGVGDESILVYLMNGQRYEVAFRLESVVIVEEKDGVQVRTGRNKEVATTDPPGESIEEDDFTFDPATDSHIAFIRKNAALFTPGAKYHYGVNQSWYEVDSLLWVREFANK